MPCVISHKTKMTPSNRVWGAKPGPGGHTIVHVCISATLVAALTFILVGPIRIIFHSYIFYECELNVIINQKKWTFGDLKSSAFFSPKDTIK